VVEMGVGSVAKLPVVEVAEEALEVPTAAGADGVEEAVVAAALVEMPLAVIMRQPLLRLTLFLLLGILLPKALKTEVAAEEEEEVPRGVPEEEEVKMLAADEEGEGRMFRRKQWHRRQRQLEFEFRH
jgi:hypothetical protein